MSHPTDRQPRVLVVDDEEEFAALAGIWLEDEYVVETATSGDEALDHLDGSVDVVLLDRRMPGVSGDDVLDEIRGRDIDCRVVMVTAVEPDFDIVKMGFDDYLVKPVTEAEVTEVVEEMLDRAAYDEWTRRFFSLISKKSALEATMSRSELASSEAYAELEAEIEEVNDHMDRAREELLAGQDGTAIFRDPTDWD